MLDFVKIAEDAQIIIKLKLNSLKEYLLNLGKLKLLSNCKHSFGVVCSPPEF